MGDRYSGRSPPRRGPLPRDRPPPPRDRDDHPNVEYFGAGESYRPGGQTGDGPYRPAPPRERERERETWNAERRDERRRDEIDSYIPPTSSRARPPVRSRSPPPYRRRSPSPLRPGRTRTELFPDRARSPPPRRYSPSRNERPRSIVSRRSRSPFGVRGRSPDNRRPRDFSPEPRRSPKRERFDSPPRYRNDRPRSPPLRRFSPAGSRSYRPRSRTPPRRDERRPNFADESWRRRSPSPRGSANTSRRSSPPVHPDRASLTGSRTHSPAHGRPQCDDRRDDTYSIRPRSPRNDYMDVDRSRSRTRDRDDHPSSNNVIPPTGPRNASYDRQPPSGPARNYTQQSSPPVGPSASVSAHNRSGTFVPPSRPRGGPPSGPSGGRFDGPPPPRDFTSPPGALRGRTSLTYRAPGYRPPAMPSQGSFEGTTPTADVATPAPPTGPRAASYGSRGGYPTGPARSSSSSYHTTADFPYRPSNASSSTTYPRSQRFDTNASSTVTSSNGAGPRAPPTGPSSISTTFNTTHQSSHPQPSPSPAAPLSATQRHLATLERIIPGGRKLPGSSGMNSDQEKRVKTLEEDAERIRADIGEKQKTKREALREWDVRERESEIAGTRSELAEAHLRALGEEDIGMVGATF